MLIAYIIGFVFTLGGIILWSKLVMEGLHCDRIGRGMIVWAIICSLLWFIVIPLVILYFVIITIDDKIKDRGDK